MLLVALLTLVWRYAAVIDDALVYARYIDNLLFLNRGLVFNAGERVEGFTSPLWLLLLIPFRALGLDYWTIFRALSLGFAVAFWLGVVSLNRAVAPAQAHRFNVPLALLGTHYGVTEYFSSGLESGLCQIGALATAAAFFFPANVALQIAVGLLPLVRPELLLASLAFFGYATWSERRIPVVALAAFAAPNAGWMFFRIAYYADFFPNTYWLKDRLALDQGFLYLANSLAGSHAGLVTVGLLLLAARIGRRKGVKAFAGTYPAARLACAFVALTVTAYVVKVGGDMLWYRLLAFPFVLSILSLTGIAETVAPSLSRGTRTAFSLVIAAAVGAAYPPQLVRHPLLDDESRHWRLIDELASYREVSELSFDAARAREDRELRDEYRRTPNMHQRVATMTWNRDALFAPDTYVVHEWGLTDPFLARVDAPTFIPGHRVGLGQAARDLASARERTGLRLQAGVTAEAVHAKNAAPWLTENARAIAIIERKVWGLESFEDRLRLAFERPTLKLDIDVERLERRVDQLRLPRAQRSD